METIVPVLPKSVPVTMGSPRFRTVEVDGFWVTEAWFPPHARLPTHHHDRASLAVMLEGSFDLHLTNVTKGCPPASVFSEPVAESHGNRIERAGAHVLVVQPDPARADLLGPCGPLFGRVTHFRDGGSPARRGV